MYSLFYIKCLADQKLSCCHRIEFFHMFVGIHQYILNNCDWILNYCDSMYWAFSMDETHVCHMFVMMDIVCTLLSSQDSYTEDQRGINMSAGLWFTPGIRALSSLLGASWALTAVWNSTSRNWLCWADSRLEIISPFEIRMIKFHYGFQKWFIIHSL